MKTGYVRDMTEGNIPRLLLEFSVPMMIGNIFQQFYNMVDSVIVGNYVSPHALGAVGACGALNFFLFGICNGMSLGIGIVMAQYFGAGKTEKVKKAVVNGFLVIVALALVLAVAGFTAARPALTLMQTPAEYIEDSILYFKTISCGILAMALYNTIAAMLRALGNSRTPLLFLILSSVVNVVLDLVFVLRFRMGVQGVAVATVVSQIISATGCIGFAISKNPYFQLKKEDLQIDKTTIRQCVRMGVPIGLQNSLISVSSVALQTVANGFGANAATAYTMTGRLEQLIHQPYSSLAAGVSTFTGQNIGARKVERVAKGLKSSIVMNGIFSLSMLGVMLLFGRYVLRLFGNDPAILEIGVRALRITSFFYFPLGMIYLIRGLCNGAGDAAYSMINGIVEVLCRFGFSLALTRIPFIGMWGIWWTTALTWSVTAIASLIRYKQKKWMNTDKLNKYL